MATKIDKAALVIAAKKIAKLRVETVGGDKSRPAETVQSCLNRGFNELGSSDGISYILRHAIKYYIGALPTTHGSTDEDQVAYWKGAYERMAARNHLLFAPLNALGFGAEEKIGWRGTFPAPSTAAHFRCEFCSAEHVNCDEIPHSSECPITFARAAFIRMQPPAGEKIRSTQDGSMEGASVTGQSPVDAPSTTHPHRLNEGDER